AGVRGLPVRRLRTRRRPRHDATARRFLRPPPRPLHLKAPAAGRPGASCAAYDDPLDRSRARCWGFAPMAPRRWTPRRGAGRGATAAMRWPGPTPYGCARTPDVEGFGCWLLVNAGLGCCRRLLGRPAWSRTAALRRQEPGSPVLVWP